ncbi:MAG TPA: hypothetical protein VMR46_02240 [Candidatus Paceibacterota bacterium]|jgi:hypothetical protein|nr:hypothetical protein [Candidatus Paceibacterota bacterium]
MRSTYRHGAILQAGAAVGCLIAAVAVVFAVCGVKTIYATLKSDHGALVMGEPSVKPMQSLADWTQEQQARGFAFSSEARSVPLSRQVSTSPYGGIVEFTTDDQQASSPLADALRQRFGGRQSGKVRYASLPPNGEG